MSKVNQLLEKRLAEFDEDGKPRDLVDPSATKQPEEEVVESESVESAVAEVSPEAGEVKDEEDVDYYELSDDDPVRVKMDGEYVVKPFATFANAARREADIEKQREELKQERDLTSSKIEEEGKVIAARILYDRGLIDLEGNWLVDLDAQDKRGVVDAATRAGQDQAVSDYDDLFLDDDDDDDDLSPEVARKLNQHGKMLREMHDLVTADRDAREQSAQERAAQEEKENREAFVAMIKNEISEARIPEPLQEIAFNQAVQTLASNPTRAANVSDVVTELAVLLGVPSGGTGEEADDTATNKRKPPAVRKKAPPAGVGKGRANGPEGRERERIDMTKRQSGSAIHKRLLDKLKKS